jgi:hypothetical protein
MAAVVALCSNSSSGAAAGREHQVPLQVQQQRPLETVARRGAVRAEAVGGVVVVVVAQRLPVAVEMLDDHVTVGGRMTMDHPLDDAQGACSQRCRR